MRHRPPGRTGWNISEISFGAWAIGGDVGRRPTTTSRCARCTARSTSASTSSTPPTSTATAARERLDRAGSARERQRRDHRRDQGRPPAAPARRRGLQPRRTSPRSSSAACAISRPTRSTCSSSTARRPTSTTCPEVFGVLDDLVAGRQAPLLRRERREAWRRRCGDRVSRTSSRCRSSSTCSGSSRPSSSSRGARERQVGILARVPLASGLLSGKMRARHALRGRRSSQLQPPRRGVRRRRDLQRRGLRRRASRPSRSCAPLVPAGRDAGAARAALDPDVRRGDLRHSRGQEPEAGRRKRPAADLPALEPDVMARVRAIYDHSIRALVHDHW